MTFNKSIFYRKFIVLSIAFLLCNHRFGFVSLLLSLLIACHYKWPNPKITGNFFTCLKPVVVVVVNVIVFVPAVLEGCCCYCCCYYCFCCYCFCFCSLCVDIVVVVVVVVVAAALGRLGRAA